MDNNYEGICYHHFSLTFPKEEIGARFKGIRFVLVAGCARRAQAQAEYLAQRLEQPSVGADNREVASGESGYEPLTRQSSRFALFQVGANTLVANHGMGPASMSIALHELLLMCKQAQILHQVTVIRFGTCGGLGVEPGTLCITNRALDPLLQDYIELKVCLKVVRRPATMDLVTAYLLEHVARGGGPGDAEGRDPTLGHFEVRVGATIGTNDFYEEQGRTNGAICEHSPEDKRKFLEAAREAGVINMEMESNYLAAMCHKLGVSFGVACVALNNRLVSDKVNLTSDEMSNFERRLFWLNYRLIKHKLSTSIDHQTTSNNHNQNSEETTQLDT